MKKATRQQTKEHNRNLVLKHIFSNESISRADIARITSLTRTTVSDIVADLLEEGLVSEIGIGSLPAGKSPILLSLVEDSRCLIGLDLAFNEFRGAVVNLRGNILRKVTQAINARNLDETLVLVYNLLDQLVQEAQQPIIGIGVGTPGLVNTSEGVVVNAVNLDWKNLPLARLLRSRYHLPVYVLNDSQAAAIGEYTYGKDHQTDENLVVINLGHGIGAGIVINGALFHGDGGSAGEIGHVVVVPEGGLPCRCGNYGCLETVASTRAIVQQMQDLAGQSPGGWLSLSPSEVILDAIIEAYHREDPHACQVVNEAGRYIGIAAASLSGILNIHKIVLTGDMARFGKGLVDTVQTVIPHMSLAGPAQNTRVEIGSLDTDGIILGASALLANNYSLLFNHPKVREEMILR